MMVNKTNSAGAPPGTLVYLGDKQTNRVKISLIEYNETEFIEKEFYDLSECLSMVDPKLVRWINVDGIHNVEFIDAIGKYFDIHPLTLEDIVNTNQRPKFEEYDNYVVSIMKMLYYNSKFISIVITFHPTYQELITIHIIPPYLTTENIDQWFNLLTIPK